VENGVRVEHGDGAILTANPAGLALTGDNPAIRIERHDLTAGGTVVIGTDLTEREVAWLRDTEWARTAEDILWRRSKLGLRFSPDEAAALARWLESAHPTDAEPPK
jgi:glycerol-3-phosphate dehydrogenase